MTIAPSNRRTIYFEKRCNEILQAISQNDTKKVQLLIMNLLRFGEQQLAESGEVNSLQDDAQEVLVLCLVPAILGLTLLSEIDTDEDK